MDGASLSDTALQATHVQWVPADKPERVRVTVPNLDQLRGDIAAHFRARKGFSLATLNLDHVVKLAADPKFRKAYTAQSHVTADGNPIVWLSKLAGQQVSLLTGADLIAPLSQLAADEQMPIALLGSTETTLRATKTALEERHPGLEVKVHIAPPMGFDPQGELADSYIAQLDEAGVGLCFLALGAPKQEMFAAHAMGKSSKVGFVSIGAGLDFIAGSQKRAPLIMRKLALEWLWRLLTNPRRLAGRYASCFAVLPRLSASALRARRANSRQGAAS